jgi:hypothetical protein
MVIMFIAALCAIGITAVDSARAVLLLERCSSRGATNIHNVWIGAPDWIQTRIPRENSSSVGCTARFTMEAASSPENMNAEPTKYWQNYKHEAIGLALKETAKL